MFHWSKFNSLSHRRSLGHCCLEFRQNFKGCVFLVKEDSPNGCEGVQDLTDLTTLIVSIHIIHPWSSMPQREVSGGMWGGGEMGEAQRKLRRTLRRTQRRTETQTERETDRERQKDTGGMRTSSEAALAFQRSLTTTSPDTLARISADSAGCDEAHVLSNAPCRTECFHRPRPCGRPPARHPPPSHEGAAGLCARNFSAGPPRLTIITCIPNHARNSIVRAPRTLAPGRPCLATRDLRGPIAVQRGSLHASRHLAFHHDQRTWAALLVATSRDSAHSNLHRRAPEP